MQRAKKPGNFRLRAFHDVPNTKYLPTFVFEESSAFSVLAPCLQVCFAVDFDYFFTRYASEVRDVSTDGKLPAKLESRECSVAQDFPQQCLSRSNALAKGPGCVDGFRSPAQAFPLTPAPLA